MRIMGGGGPRGVAAVAATAAAAAAAAAVLGGGGSTQAFLRDGMGCGWRPVTAMMAVAFGRSMALLGGGGGGGSSSIGASALTTSSASTRCRPGRISCRATSTSRWGGGGRPGVSWWSSATTRRASASTTVRGAATKVPEGATQQIQQPTQPQSDDTNDSINDAEAAAVLAHLKSPFLRIMRDRGFLHQCTSYTELDNALLGSNSKEDDEGDTESNKKVVRAYLGFDATADSLHVGSLLQIMILRWFQKCGHQPVVLLGGGTSKVGDPTGKDESRILLTDAVIQSNIIGISQVFAKFLDLADTDNHHDAPSTTAALIVNNNDWLTKLSYLDFLRDYGTHFTINRMLSFESVKQRLAREAPLTFLEFNYMILQAYDFLELHRRFQVVLQLGGSDQWGNMIAGVELGRKVDGAQLFALTAPLLTTSDGRKMGKTASGAVWLNADRLSPYEYWQFWRNADDRDVIRFLKLFTELPLTDIDEMSTWMGTRRINDAKVVLADRATELLHGPDVLPGIHETIQQMFSTTSASGGATGATGSMKTEGLVRVQVTRARLEEGGIRIADLLAELGLAPSKKEARRLIAGGGARKSSMSSDAAAGSDDEVKIVDETAVLTLDDFGSGDANAEVVLRAGKKRAGVVELVD